MKKLFALLMLACVLAFSVGAPSYAQDNTAVDGDTTALGSEDAAATPIQEEPVETTAALDEEPAVEKTFHQVVKEKFIEGSWEWMTPVLLCLIIGLAIAIERIITLNL